MLDRHISHVVESPDTIEVHHHRAPTDASLRLLGEMQKKAKASVLSSLVVNENAFKGTVSLYSNPVAFGRVVVVSFSLNGKKYTKEHPVDLHFAMNNTDAHRMLREALLEAMVAALEWKIEPAAIRR